jgi:hypothetical protein
VETAAIAEHLTAEVLVRYAFATTAQADGGKNEALAAKHKAVLATIAGSGSPIDPASSRRELQILAAAVLARLFSSRPEAAIAVLNASFGGMRTADLPMDLAGLARCALVEFSRKKHARPAAKEFEIVAPTLDFEVPSDESENVSGDHLNEELERLRDAAQTATQAIVEGQNRVTKLLARQISLGEEELQMLWWLIGAHSSVAGAPFAEVNAALKPLAFGHELGQLTAISPGPASVTALLSRAGVANDMLKVSDTVNAANIGWIKEITKSSRVSPVTTPLHFALEKRGEIGSDDTWLPIWVSMTGLPADASMPAVKLAELFYCEHLFLHVNG